MELASQWLGMDGVAFANCGRLHRSRTQLPLRLMALLLKRRTPRRSQTRESLDFATDGVPRHTPAVTSDAGSRPGHPWSILGTARRVGRAGADLGRQRSASMT
jgi:hypothetical protein